MSQSKSSRGKRSRKKEIVSRTYGWTENTDTGDEAGDEYEEYVEEEPLDNEITSTSCRETVRDSLAAVMRIEDGNHDRRIITNRRLRVFHRNLSAFGQEK